MKKKNTIEYDYAIVGGGITGLYLAYRLSKTGRKVVVLERNSNLGGLAALSEIAGERIEKAYHHFFPSDSDLLNLLLELGLTENIKWKRVPMAIYNHKQWYQFTYPWDVFRLPEMNIVDKLRLGISTFWLQKRSNWKEMSRVPAAEWLQKYSGYGAWDAFWQPLLTGKFHHFAEEISLAWLWARLSVRGNARDSMFKPEKLGYLQGSLKVLFEELRNQGNFTINTNWSVGGVKQKQEHVQLHQERGAEHIQAKQLIFTNSTAQVYQLLGLQQKRSPRYLGAMVGVFSSPQKLTDYYWTNVYDSASPFVVFLNHTALIHRRNYQNQYIYYFGTYLPHEHKHFIHPQQFEQESYKYLTQMFPRIRLERITEKQVHRFPFAQHVVDTNYQETIAPTRLNDRIWLCNFSQIYPHDRGLNYALKQADQLLDSIEKVSD